MQRRWRWQSSPLPRAPPWPARRLAARVPPPRRAARRAARRRGPRRGQARPPARVGACCTSGTRGWRPRRSRCWLSVAAGERGEVGRLPRLGALRLLARAARHRPRADHGLAGNPRPRRRAGRRSVRQAPPQERAAVAGLAPLAGLVSHTPQQDEEGFWWRTIIELHAVPQLPAELLQEAVDRRAGWPARERRRDARGRRSEPHGDPAPGAAHQGAEALQGHRPPS